MQIKENEERYFLAENNKQNMQEIVSIEELREAEVIV